MADLEETINIVLERMKKYRPLYEQNEMAVRNQIVNPVLRSLGWNPENPDEVQPNISTEEGIPDYCLLKNGKKVLFIEAKKLSVDIEQKDVIRQIARYCFGEGMRYGILTNGAIWVLFRAFEEGTRVSERLVWKADIENDDPTAIVRRLNTISKGNIENIEMLIKNCVFWTKYGIRCLRNQKKWLKGLFQYLKVYSRRAIQSMNLGPLRLRIS